MNARPVLSAASRLPLAGRHLSGLDWSSDGRYLAVASTAPVLSIWEVARPERVVHITLPAAGVAGPFWGPKTDKIAMLLADGSVGLWSNATGERLDVVCDPLSDVVCGRWAPDGTALAGVIAGRIGLWDSYRGGPKRLLQTGPRAEVLEWAPDSTMIASGGGRAVQLWNARTGALKRRLDGAPGRILSLAWSPDARMIAAAGTDDAQIRVWSTRQTGGIVQLLPTGAAQVDAIAFSRCGSWLACKDAGGRLRLWETAGWQERAVVLESSGTTAGTSLLAFSPVATSVAAYDPTGAQLTVYDVQQATADPSAAAETPTAAAPRKVFVSYARADRKYLDQLLVALEPLRQERGLEIWSDRAIDAGMPWNEEIRGRLAWADIILFLVSPPLFSSKYISDVEWQIAMERHRAGAAIVVPVVLRIADWETTAIGAIQALPEGAKPITTWSNKDAAFRSVVDGLRRLIAKAR
jgi:dipeptidyl aminopeptidase/acylaminoacyl peptidase